MTIFKSLMFTLGMLGLCTCCFGCQSSEPSSEQKKLDNEIARNNRQAQAEIVSSTKRFCKEHTESMKNDPVSEEAKSYEACVARMLANVQISEADSKRSQLNAERREREISDLQDAACQIDPASPRC